MKIKQNISSFLSVFLIYAIILTSFLDLNANDEVKNIKSTIKSYNNGIIYASRDDNSDRLRSFANKKIVTKFHLWLKSWHDNNLFMDAKIKDINFTKVDLSNHKAVAITNEQWSYRYINIQTKKEVQPKTDINYTVRYNLSKEETKWIIQKIDVLSEEKRQN